MVLRAISRLILEGFTAHMCLVREEAKHGMLDGSKKRVQRPASSRVKIPTRKPTRKPCSMPLNSSVRGQKSFGSDERKLTIYTPGLDWFSLPDPPREMPASQDNEVL